MLVGLLFQLITLTFAYLLFSSIAAVLSERSGIINISINGNMIAGALIFTSFAKFANENNALGNSSQFLALFLAGCAGLSLSFLNAFSAIKFKTNQIISGTAINIFVAGLALFIISLPTIGSGFFQSNYTLISIDSKYKIVNIFLISAIVLVVSVYIFLKWTKQGLHLIGCGENPNALDEAGVNVIKIRYLTSLFSGFISGLAGAIFVFTTSNVFKGNVQGAGFIAIAIMVFGQWRILGIIFGALIFSSLLGLSEYLPSLYPNSKAISENRDLLLMMPFVLTIGTMIIFYKYNNVPLVEGKAFIRGLRS